MFDGWILCSNLDIEKDLCFKIFKNTFKSCKNYCSSIGTVDFYLLLDGLLFLPLLLGFAWADGFFYLIRQPAPYGKHMKYSKYW